MKRTLLAVGIAILISTLCVPCSDMQTDYVLFFVGGKMLWGQSVLQMIFLAVAAAVIVNLFPRRHR